MNHQMKHLHNQTLRINKYQQKTPPIIEIYDLEALEIDSQSSSPSSYSSSNDFNQIKNKKPHMNSLYSSSSASSSPRSSIESSSLFQSDTAFDKPFTFQEFISAIINCNDNKWHKLIIQDLARLLELKFRDFRKEFVSNQAKPSGDHSDQQNQQITNKNYSYSSVYLNTESDLFIHMAEKIFELASEEPNGILGAILNLKLQCDNGKVYHICKSTPYDQTTIATSEITVTLKEDATGFKKFLQAFRWYSHIGKYLALQIDSKNFEVTRERLY